MKFKIQFVRIFSAMVLAYFNLANASEEKAVKTDISDNAQDDVQTLEAETATAYVANYVPLDTPINTTFIDSETLENSPFSNVADALRAYGNINITSVTGSYNLGNVSMRGFGENSQTRVLVMVDGQKLTRADMGSINWLQIPLFDVESIEILRGAQSALYGSTAEAGVIKITTIVPKDKDGITGGLRATYGSWDTYNVGLRVAGREGDYFFTANVNQFSTNGWRESSNSESQSANASFGLDLDSKNTLVFTGNFANTIIQYPGPITLQQFDIDPRYSKYNGLNVHLHSKDGLYTATLKNESDIGHGQISAGWNFRDMDSNLGGNTHNFQWTATISPEYIFNVGENAHTLFGLDAYADKVNFKKQYKYPAQTGTDYLWKKADAKRGTLSPYLGGEWEPIDGLTFSVAGRFEAQKSDISNLEYLPETLYPYKPIQTPRGIIWVKNDKYPPQINPANTYNDTITLTGWGANFSINYKIDTSKSVFFKFDQIYHTPVLDEIGVYQGSTLPLMFNRYIKPEHGQNYEVGTKYFTGHWSFTGSIYLTELIDEISYYEDAYENWLNTNIPPTRRMGADIEARYDTDFWGAGAMLSAVEARFSSGKYSGKDIPLVPNYCANFSAYIRPLRWITLSTRVDVLSSQFTGTDYENTGGRIPAYALLSFQARFEVCRYGALFFSVENALDKHYISCAWQSGYYPGSGRMLMAGIDLKF